MKINEFTEGKNPLFKINKFLDDKKKREEYARKLQQQRDAEDKEKVEEDLSSLPPLADLIVMAVVGQTTVAALKAAWKTGKYALKLKRLADKAGVKLNNAVMGESNPFTDARMNAIKAGKKEFTVNGKKYQVTGDTSDEREAIELDEDIPDMAPVYRNIKSGINDAYGTIDELDFIILKLQKTIAEEYGEDDVPDEYLKPLNFITNTSQKITSALRHIADIAKNDEIFEAVNRDEYIATLAAKQNDKFFAAALAALDRLVKSDPRGQDVGGYAFDIARAFNGVNGKELVAAYSASAMNEESGKTIQVSELDTLKLPDIAVGDEVMVGKFKNRKAEVKGFSKDAHNQPVLKTTKGDQKLFKPRLSKLTSMNEENGKEMLQIFRGMHHDAGMNKNMDRYIQSHDWKLGDFTPDMFPSEEEFFDYDDPFDRIIDIDYSHRVNLSQPIIVGPQFSDGKYSVIDGNHRAASAQKMGKTIQAYFPINTKEK